MTNPEDVIEKILLAEMERYIKANYDNPQRVGCPDDSFLKKAALEPLRLNAKEKSVVVQHVTKCAQCYSEVKRLKRAEK